MEVFFMPRTVANKKVSYLVFKGLFVNFSHLKNEQ